MENKIFVISGATASGKSSLAMDLSSHKNISIINADSLQIYKDLPILSAQPSESEKSEVKHYLYSYLDYDQSSTVMDWLRNVDLAIKESFANDLTPVIVGGTGMYISMLLNGINKIPEISGEVKKLSSIIYENNGRDGLIDEILKLDPDQNEIKYTDQQRLIRQYEVLKQTGKSISYWHNMPNEFIIDPEKFCHINIEINRNDLYNKCNERFLAMLESVQTQTEVQNLMQKIGDNEDYQVTKTIGYVEIRDYLLGKITKDKAIEIASQKTRNYAKRQLTWFRNQFDNANVFDSSDRALEFMIKQQNTK